MTIVSINSGNALMQFVIRGQIGPSSLSGKWQLVMDTTIELNFLPEFTCLSVSQNWVQEIGIACFYISMPWCFLIFEKESDGI